MRLIFWPIAVAAIIGAAGAASAVGTTTVVPGFAEANYEISDTVYGNHDLTGTSIGTHTLDLGNGTGASAKISDGAEPSLRLSGGIGSGQENFLRLSASYDYDALVIADARHLPGFQTAISTNVANRGAVVAYATGFIRFEGTSNTDARLSIAAASENSSSSTSWSCDGGSCYGRGGDVPTGVDVPYSFALTAADFGYGCDPHAICYVTADSRPFTRISLSGAAGVGYSGDGQGNSIGGSVLALLDPRITLNPDFFVANNLSFNDFSVGITSGAGAGAVPEPASWAMMIGGFAMVGGRLRRRRSIPAQITA